VLMPSGFDHSLGNEIGCLGFLAGLEFLYTHPPGPPRRRKQVVRGRSAIEVVTTFLLLGAPGREAAVQ
jgi:hypothetical protein